MPFHLTEAGDPRPCSARLGRCPYGGVRDHYGSQEEAREAYEAAHFGQAFAQAMRRNPAARAMEEQIERNERVKRELYQAYASAPPVTTTYQEAPEEALRAFNEVYCAYDERLTEEERQALYDYTGISYDPLNRFLRDRPAFEADSKPETLSARIAWAERQTALLDEALAKAPRIQRRLFRRLDQDGRHDVRASESWAAELGFVEGATVTFTAYSSTTVNPGYIARTTQHDLHTSVVLALTTDVGAPAGPTVYDRARTHTQEGEAEILLPRDLTFQVERVERAAYQGSEADEPVEVLTVHLRPVQEPVR